MIPTLMRGTVAAATVGFLALCWQVAPVGAAPQDWTQYRNDRYGFTLEYPADLFKVERTAAAGDGQVFAAEGDARLLVGALVNESGFTPASYQDYVARRSYGNYRIEYRRLGGSWFVLSGEGNGRIFYEKVIFSCGGKLINSFAMIYPADRREIFDRVVERVENTFQPGRECERAGLAPAPSKPKRVVRSQRKPEGTARAAGERSALADSIARARGHDVIVILRRNGPPYDRKVLRGYVSPP